MGDGTSHAWFLAFAPAEKPTIAIAVVVENGGRGGEVASPIRRHSARGVGQMSDERVSRIERMLEQTARKVSGGGLHPLEILQRVQDAVEAA